MTEPIDVLLLAADPLLQDFLAEEIEATGRVRLTIVESPDEARTLLRAYRYGIVVATNFGIGPWQSIDVIPVHRSYEAMFISGYWDDDLMRECRRRRVHYFRAPVAPAKLRDKIIALSRVATARLSDPDNASS